MKIKTTEEIHFKWKVDKRCQKWIAVDDLIKEYKEMLNQVDKLPGELINKDGYSLICYADVRVIITKLFDNLVYHSEWTNNGK